MSAAVKKPTPPSTVGRRSASGVSSTSISSHRISSKSSSILGTSGNGHNGGNTHSANNAQGMTTSHSQHMNRNSSTRGSPASPISARAAVRRPSHKSSLSSNVLANTLDHENDDNSRAETVALIEDLKSQLLKAESTSGDYQRQLTALQSRLDEALSEQSRLEDRVHDNDEAIAKLETENKESLREHTELEQTYESEKQALIKDKEEQIAKEEELQGVIKRLKETIAQKEMRTTSEGEEKLSRSSSFQNRTTSDAESGQFAPSSSIEQGNSGSSSKLILQKDKMIESLRLELAEVHVKLVEMENMGDGRLQALEKTLLETRQTNARLMEDNESYQLLLSEKTLNGDFAKAEFMQGSSAASNSPSGLGSLADELESATEGEKGKCLEAELKTVKDQNKAMTLYIEKIIGRLLQHEGFETILDKNSEESPKSAEFNKDSPPPPPPKDDEFPPTFIQRAKSAVSGTNTRPKPRRPMSTFQPATFSTVPTAHEDPNTAPSIPIGRVASHRRTRSDLANNHASSVATHMYRPSPTGGPNGPISPIIGPGMTSPRQSLFQFPHNGPRSHPSSRAASATIHTIDGVGASSDSVRSSQSGDAATNSSSPPRSTTSKYTPAVMTQNKMRPLRLVQEASEFDHNGRRCSTGDKKANRSSWMGWFTKNKDDSAKTESSE